MVSSVNLFGRLPEIDLKLSNGLSVLSVTSLEGDPDWTLFQRSEEISNAVYIRAGQLRLDETLADLRS